MTKLKVLTLVLGLVFLCAIAKNSSAQNIETIRADHNTYLTGTGRGETLKAADQAALTEIIEQISIQVESSFETTKTEMDKNLRETVKDVVNTYSNATLNNTERIILQDEPDAKVFRYIKRTEITKIFESRKNKIIELAHNGEIALGNLQIADALRYFYWSQMLLRSHPLSSDIKTQCSGKEVLLITWLPVQINQIFSNLSFEVDTVEQNLGYSNYILNILYKDRPVQNLDYSYWNGRDWSNIVSSKNGTGVVELPMIGEKKVIRLKTEYAFEGEANIDMELRNVMEKLPQIPYKNSYFDISSLPRPKPVAIFKKDGQAVSGIRNDADSGENLKLPLSDKHADSIPSLTNVDKNNLTMKCVITAIMHKDFDSVRNLFTEEGFSIYMKLLKYGNAQIIKSFDLKYFQYGDYVICRSIPMSFSFKANNRTFIEDVVFYLDQKQKICNLTFGLANKTIEDIASNKSWSEANRVLLISFLENYKTAFSLKRFDYISNIFSDDALIITGLNTKAYSSGDTHYANNNIIKYNRQSKSDYLKRLKYSFDSKEYINIRFAENSVRRSGKGNDIYGIQIKQDYFSANYGDSGYLFLLVDLSDTLKPQIHVRTWQPEKNSDGSIYGLADF